MRYLSRLFKGFVMSLSMFSIIPTPNIWDEDSFCWVLPMLPVVGLIIGALWGGLALLFLNAAGIVTLRAAALLLFPLIMSGFIHLDGFMDTSDALFSRAELSKKREILKDPHVGSFAAIALGVYLLLGYASLCPAVERGVGVTIFVLIPVLSRCVAGIAAYSAKPIFDRGFGASFTRDANILCRMIAPCIAVICVCAGYFTGGIAVIYPLAALLTGGTLSAIYAVRHMNGISGDLCGFIIVMSELLAIVALAVTPVM